MFTVREPAVVEQHPRRPGQTSGEVAAGALFRP